MRQAVQQYTIVVAVANPATVAELIQLAAFIAEEHGGRLIATSVIPAPDEPAEEPDAPQEAFSNAQNLVKRAEQAAQARGLACECRVAVGQHIHQGIASVAEAYDADLLVMGMSQRRHPRLTESEFDFDRIVDGVAAEAPCNVLVARFAGEVRFARVLLPVADSTDADLTREVIIPLYHRAGADIDFIHFVAADEETSEARQRLGGWLSDAELEGFGRLMVKVASDPASAIIRASKSYDIVVVGTPPLYLLKRQLLGSLAEQVIHEARCTTLVMRTRGSR